MPIIYLYYLHYYLLHTVTQTDISTGGLKASNVGQDSILLKQIGKPLVPLEHPGVLEPCPPVT